VIYRDGVDQCPRCGTGLLDARAARGCETCGGLWIGVGDVQEMMQKMRVPLEPMQVPFERVVREQLPCPACRTPMETHDLYGVPIDLCPKHGIWFDAQELAAVLFAAARARL